MADAKAVLVVGAGEATGGAIARRFAREVKERGGILDPEAIAENYWRLHVQARSAWTRELDLRPWTEPW